MAAPPGDVPARVEMSAKGDWLADKGLQVMGVRTMLKITKKERAAIDALQKVADNWPKSLWLFSANGSLFVMKKEPGGNRVTETNGSFDQQYLVDKISGIENDGGDF